MDGFGLKTDSNESRRATIIPAKAAALEVRSMAAVVAAFVLVEAYLHQLRGYSLALGFMPAALTLAVAALAYMNYRRLGGFRWTIVGSVLAFVGISLIIEAAAIEPLPRLTLSPGFPQPRHGLVAITHLVSDFSVLGLGVFLLFLSFHLRASGIRSSGSAVAAVASLTACCGTTASLLTTLLSVVLGSAAIHVSFPWVLGAVLLTISLLALAFALTSGFRLVTLTRLFLPRRQGLPH